MQLGDTVNVNDVYFVLKDQITPTNAVPYLEDLAKHAVFYERFLFPDHEPNESLRAALWRIRRLEVGVSYPFLLRCYAQHSAGQLSLDEFIEILNVIENFLIRRFVCNVPTYGLNKVFPPLFTQIQRAKSKTLCDGLKVVLQSKNYPKDYDFRSKLRDAKLYGPGDRVTKTKLIREALESAFEHKEQVPYDKLTIEHVMPQTLSDDWKTQLGSDWQMVHELYLHTLGNLTLTAYNSELSNEPYPTKRKLLQESHIELNGTFSDYETWTTESIDDRAAGLSEMALAVWPYFGADPDGSTASGNVVGKSPKALWILGQRYDVSSWRDVLELTVDTIADLEPDGFERILEEFPRFVGRDKNKFRSVRELKCGAFVEVNLGAEAIYRFCYQSIEVLGLSSDEWTVETA